MGASIKRVKVIKLGAVLVLLQLCTTMALHAQVSGNHYHLQEKYWNYRERYKKLFIEIGSERNQGIPITKRFNYLYAAGKMEDYVEPDCAAGDNVATS